MKTKDRKISSYVAIIDSFIDLAELHPEESKVIKQELKTYINVRFGKNQWVHPEITKFCTDWYREFYRLVGGKDPYRNLKDKSNELGKKIISNLQITGLKPALACGIIGNKMDYGAVLVHRCNLSATEKDFDELDKFRFDFDDTAILKRKLDSAKTVLFLVDNCGEIIFDTFFLQEISEKIGKENLWIMAKETPMLNDATVEDLKNMGLDQYGQIVSTGSNCFGLHKEDVSEECRKLLRKADLIIAKGQAYLEFFTEYNFENVFNVLIVKYPIINPAFGTLNSGCRAVISSEQYAKFGKSYF